MDAGPAESLERRKQVRVRLRPDLQIEPQRFGGRTFYVVKDPVTLRYYRFKDREQFLLRFLDGSRTLDEARREFEERFRPQRLRLEEVEGFAHLLLTAGLAYHDAPQAGRFLFEQHEKYRRQRRFRKWTDLWYIRVPIFDPDRLLGRLARRLRWAFTPWFALASLGLMAAALLLVAAHFDTVRNRLPAFYDFFSWGNVALLWGVLAVVKVLHELGHGLTCKAFGGEVHEMGALFLCFAPCLYCNVSDAWTLPSKWKRILIGFAGIYVELLLAALATFVWWNTPGRPLVNHLALSLMVVCGVSTVVFNANPLLRYDGYYILSDWLEVPNLRERAGRVLNRAALALFLGVERPREPYTTRGRRFLLAGYALASHAYRWLVTWGVLWFLYAFLKRYKLGPLGGLLVVLAVASMGLWPLAQALARFFRRGWSASVRTSRSLASGALFGVGIFLFVLAPLPLSGVRQLGLVEVQPDAAAKVFVPTAAVLERLYVHEGQRVRAQDLLADFRSLALETQREEARSEYDIRVVQVRALEEQWQSLADARDRAAVDALRAAAAAERDFFAAQAALLDQQVERLVLRAPRDGVVLGAPRADEVGRLWHREEAPFGVIADTSRLRALVPVSPSEYQLLQEELSARGELIAAVRGAGTGRLLGNGKIRRLPESEAVEVPLALTLKGGGPLAAAPATRPDAYVPQTQQYLVEVEMPGGEAMVPGTLVRVQVPCRRRSAAWWLWRAVTSTFELGLAY